MKGSTFSTRISLLVAVLCLAGCTGNLRSIHHSFSVNDGGSISVDASQRAIISVKKAPPNMEPWVAVCAEPSPDAISALSASAGFSAELLQRALAASASAQESVASIGLRTQSITILRDAMYRLCEGYASAALDEFGFTRLQRRYQNVMLGLLAIEQLTGAMAGS